MEGREIHVVGKWKLGQMDMTGSNKVLWFYTLYCSVWSATAMSVLPLKVDLPRLVVFFPSYSFRNLVPTLWICSKVGQITGI